MKEPATLMHSIRQRLLAHFEKSALFAPDDPAMEAVPADSGQLLYAPVSGRIRALTRIKDPVFSSEVLGKGCAIEPSCGEVVAPADGIVEKIAKTHHAISLLCDNGMEVLIHVGMDTVELTEFLDLLGDYADVDSNRRLYGREEDDYEGPGGASLPRNGPLQFREELFWLDGLPAVLAVCPAGAAESPPR